MTEKPARLDAKILNLQSDKYDAADYPERLAYITGHQEARLAAAELATEAAYDYEDAKLALFAMVEHCPKPIQDCPVCSKTMKLLWRICG